MKSNSGLGGSTFETKVMAAEMASDGDNENFLSQLAFANRWTLGQSAALVHEYKRFVILTQIAPGFMCPSDAVDRVWHAHLTETETYRKMCLALPGGFLDHHPAGAGEVEHLRHQRMYGDTLDAYQKHFGEAPPSQYWPPVDTRFTPLRSSDREAVVFTGASPLQLTLVCTFIFLFLGCLCLSPLTSASDPVSALAVYLVCLLVLQLAVWAVGRSKAGPPPSQVLLDPYEVAWMARGRSGIAAAAAASLIERGLMRVDRSPARDQTAPTLFRIGDQKPSPTDLRPAELLLLANAGSSPLSYRAATLVVARMASTIRTRLAAAGLARDVLTLPSSRLALLLVSSTVLAVGGSLVLAFAMTPGQRWALALLMSANFLQMLSASGGFGRLSYRGAQILSALKRDDHQSAEWKRTLARVSGGSQWSVLATAVALGGMAALPQDPRFSGLAEAIDRHGWGLDDWWRDGWDDPGKDSSLAPRSQKDGGGGGCGGGGGGCGGCG